MSTVLTGAEIRHLINQKPSLVAGFVNLEEQLQANGFDLTLRDIAVPGTPGQVVADSSQRRVSELKPLTFEAAGQIDLSPGAYVITFNEVVSLPVDVMALATPRSSLLRCSVSVHTAVWDAGYHGRSQALLVVYNPLGFRLQKGARVIQLVFFRLTTATEGYRGAYQGENTA